jgi:endonuclease YncB( thermonuclease family)
MRGSRLMRWLTVRLAIGAVLVMGAGVGYFARAAAPPPRPPARPPAARPPAARPPLPPGARPAIRPARPALPPGALAPRPLPRLRPVAVRRAAVVHVVTTVDQLPAVPVPMKEVTSGKAYKVQRVGDDLTVALSADGEELPVRLLGVVAGDAPKWGQASKRFLEGILLGEFVYVKYDETLEEADEDGTTAAYLFRAPDGLFANLEVVRQGHGLAATDYEYQYRTQFRFYEEKAQADDKGLWADVKRTE